MLDHRCHYSIIDPLLALDFIDNRGRARDRDLAFYARSRSSILGRQCSPLMFAHYDPDHRQDRLKSPADNTIRAIPQSSRDRRQ